MKMIQIRQLGTIIAGMVLMTVFPCVYGQSRADLDKIAASFLLLCRFVFSTVF